MVCEREKGLVWCSAETKEVGSPGTPGGWRLSGRGGGWGSVLGSNLVETTRL